MSFPETRSDKRWCCVKATPLSFSILYFSKKVWRSSRPFGCLPTFWELSCIEWKSIENLVDFESSNNLLPRTRSRSGYGKESLTLAFGLPLFSSFSFPTCKVNLMMWTAWLIPWTWSLWVSYSRWTKRRRTTKQTSQASTSLTIVCETTTKKKNFWVDLEADPFYHLLMMLHEWHVN